VTGSLVPPAPLSADHDLSRFDCGRAPLNDWLRERALDSEGRTARTYVVCEGSVVVGYYCIAAGSVERQALPSRLKRAQGLPGNIPVTIIGRLARDLRYRGTGLGRDLLRDALIRCLSASQVVGSRAVLTHALDEEAARFWTGCGFVESPIGSRTFFLAMERVVEAV
jgi:GNAT superfamily N-acetyltransferase